VSTRGLIARDPAALPTLGAASGAGPFVLDTNVFINALTKRGPLTLRAVLADLSESFVSAPTLAELRWMQGRLDQDHPATARILSAVAGALTQIDPAKVLVPTAEHWGRAGERAGAAVRTLAGPQRSFRAAADRQEMLNDALTAIVAAEAGLPVLTADRDFDVLQQLDPALKVLFYG
jgi:predicted nucleic acid-binding protein